MTEAILCTRDLITVRRIAHCPTCDQRRRFAGFDEGWYGPTMTCLACGDSWSGGEQLSRPFKPRWRQEARQRAARAWRSAVRLGSREHQEWMKAQLEEVATRD